MAYSLGDIYIGDFPITQAFGARPEVYSARYGLKGHNGIDIGSPSLTLVLSAADGFVSEIGNDLAGYGNYLKIVHDGFLTLYAHLNDIVVKKGDHVVAGQLIAHSNNTGFSDAPHLHFGVAPCDGAGIKTDPNNGYSGYIDPSGSLCEWNVQDLKKPVDPTATDVATSVSVPSFDFVRMNAQGSNYKLIASFLLGQGVNQYFSEQGLPLIDLDKNGQDPMAGEHIVSFLASKLSALNKKSEQTQNVPVDPQATATIIPEQLSDQEQAAEIVKTATPLSNLLKKLYTNFVGFIFVSK